MKILTLISITLLGLNSFSNAKYRITHVCSDLSGATILTLGTMANNANQRVMGVNGSPGQGFYSITETNSVLTGINGRSSIRPQLDLRTNIFKANSTDIQGTTVKCRPQQYDL